MIDSFRDRYYFLSNFYPCVITYQGISYRSVESAFQAQKVSTVLSGKARAAQQRRFSNLRPDQAKHLGRHISLRPDWERVKNDIMRDLLKVKFSDVRFKAWLLSTGDEELIEGNTWHDNYWGICRCSRCRDRGRNELGKALMALRRELQETGQTQGK